VDGGSFVALSCLGRAANPLPSSREARADRDLEVLIGGKDSGTNQRIGPGGTLGAIVLTTEHDTDVLLERVVHGSGAASLETCFRRYLGGCTVVL